MPTYDYRCKACEHQFEEFQNISAPPLKECPVCSGEVVRLISGGTGLIFKGSGFYITDYTGKSAEGKDKKTSAANGTPVKSNDKSDGAVKEKPANTDSGTAKNDKPSAKKDAS